MLIVAKKSRYLRNVELVETGVPAAAFRRRLLGQSEAALYFPMLPTSPVRDRESHIRFLANKCIDFVLLSAKGAEGRALACVVPIDSSAAPRALAD